MVETTGEIDEIGGATSWLGSELRDSPDWKVTISEEQASELVGAVRDTERRGLALTDMSLDNFHAPSFAPLGEQMLGELLDGRGFTLLRGLPVQQLVGDEVDRMLWGIGLHLGRAVPQNVAGDLVYHVRNQGMNSAEQNVRGSQTSGELDVHSDLSDIVSLLCVRDAKSGGVSRIVSAVAVHDELVRKRRDLARLLYQPWWQDSGVGSEAQRLSYRPIFCANQGRVFTLYSRRAVESATRYDHVPSLSHEQVEALDAFRSLTASVDYPIDMRLEPGDLQLINNYFILHGRTAYEDWHEPERQRDLCRQWLLSHRSFGLPDNGFGRGIWSR